MIDPKKNFYTHL